MRSLLMEFDCCLVDKLALLRQADVPEGLVAAFHGAITTVRRVLPDLAASPNEMPALMQLRIRAWWQSFELERRLAGDAAAPGSVLASRSAADALRGGTWKRQFLAVFQGLPPERWKVPLANPARVVFGPWLEPASDASSASLDHWALAADWQQQADVRRSEHKYGLAERSRRKLCAVLADLAEAESSEARQAWLMQLFELGVDLQRGGQDTAAIETFDQVTALLAEGGAALQVEQRLLRARTLTLRGQALKGTHRTAEAIDSYAAALTDYERLIELEDTASHRCEQAVVETWRAWELAGCGAWQQSLAGHERALEALQRLVDLEGRADLRPLLLASHADHAEALRRTGQPRRAADALDRVLASVEALVEASGQIAKAPIQLRLEAARIRGLRADVNDDLGRIDDALRDYDHSIAAYDALIAEIHSNSFGILRARLATLAESNDAAGMAELYERARFSIEDCLAHGRMPQMEQLVSARADRHHDRAIALTAWGRLSEGIASIDEAITAYGQLTNQGSTGPLRPRLASMHVTRGHALQDQGRLDEAIAEFDRAIEIHERLIQDEDKRQYRSWRASACVSRAVALNLHGCPETALAAHEQANADYARLIESEGQPGLLPAQAWAGFRHGTTLLDARLPLQALAAFDLALSRYDRLINGSGAHQLRSRRAWAASERARALGELDRREDAAAAADQACAEFDRLIDDMGVLQLRSLRARSRVVAGMALRRLGRWQEASTRFEAATAEYLQLMEVEGQWEYLAAAVDAVTASWFAACALGDEKDMARHTACLVRWLGQAPLDRGHHQLAALLRWLAQAKQAWRGLMAGSPGEAARLSSPLWQAHWRALLDWASDLLREPNALWLGRLHVKVRLQGLLQHLFELAESQGPQELTQWFLQTQCLRAQRAALMAETEDEELLSWRSLWLEHDAMVTELLHPSHGADNRSGSGNAVGHRPDEDAPVRSQEDESRAQARMTQRRLDLDARRRECRRQLEALRIQLERNGKLPAEHALTLLHLDPLLPPRHALLLLAPRPGGKGWLAQLVARAPLAVGAETETSGLLHRSWTLYAGFPEGRSGLDRALADVDASMARRQGQRSLRDGPGADEAGRVNTARMDTTASLATAQALHQALAQALQPALAQLADWDCRAVTLVPAGLLHGVPWLRVLQALPEARPLQLRLYPSVAAWWQASAPSRVPTAPRPAAPPRVATLMHDALLSHAPLPWVHLELALMRQLWGEATASTWVELPRERPRWPPEPLPPAVHGNTVDCLITIGHSADREGTGVRSGLLLGKAPNGADRVFTGFELAGIKHARRLLLSCCTLGRLGDSLGETQGLVSTAFSYDTRFASGSLLRVGDVEATLFSAAFHWALKAAYEASLPAREPSWAAVFLSVQNAVAAGAWPPGFGAWLAHQLPELAHGLWQCKPAACINTQRTWRDVWGAQLVRQTRPHADGIAPREWQGSEAQLAALQALARAWGAAPPESLQELAHWLVCMGD